MKSDVKLPTDEELAETLINIGKDFVGDESFSPEVNEQIKEELMKCFKDMEAYYKEKGVI